MVQLPLYRPGSPKETPLTPRAQAGPSRSETTTTAIGYSAALERSVRTATGRCSFVDRRFLQGALRRRAPARLRVGSLEAPGVDRRLRRDPDPVRRARVVPGRTAPPSAPAHLRSPPARRGGLPPWARRVRGGDHRLRRGAQRVRDVERHEHRPLRGECSSRGGWRGGVGDQCAASRPRRAEGHVEPVPAGVRELVRRARARPRDALR